MHNRRGARRRATAIRTALTATVAAAIASLVFALPVWAHVEVSADNAQAGARNVTLTFVGEAESTTAGIASEQVVLPAGISPQSVRLAKAPDGWTFTATPDGFVVAGKALPIGEDATFSVVVDQLPTGVTELAFKTLETYGDGSVIRWIEIPEAGKPEPENPAPLLTLAPGTAPAPTTAGPAATTPGTAAAPGTASTTSVTSTSSPAGGSNAGWWIAAAVVVVLAALAGGLLVARRRRQTPPPGQGS